MQPRGGEFDHHTDSDFAAALNTRARGQLPRHYSDAWVTPPGGVPVDIFSRLYRWRTRGRSWNYIAHELKVALQKHGLYFVGDRPSEVFLKDRDEAITAGYTTQVEAMDLHAQRFEDRSYQVATGVPRLLEAIAREAAARSAAADGERNSSHTSELTDGNGTSAGWGDGSAASRGRRQQPSPAARPAPS